MRILTFIVFISLFNSAFSQAYLKDYLASKTSVYETGELIPVIIKLNKQVDVLSLKQDLLKRNLTLKERQQIIVETLYQENSSPSLFDSYINNLKLNNPLEIKQIVKFWMVNAVACRVSVNMLDAILLSPDVDYIQYDMETYGEEVREGVASNVRAVGGAEIGLVAIHARDLWAMGYTGRNRIAMNIDTGVNVEHPSLNDRFLGNYLSLSQAWFGYEHDSPYDIDQSHFHGTHTMGTMIGLDTATADTIGLAMNSFWIASDPVVTSMANIRPMSEYFRAFEWALNPDGNIETSDDIPDVINNSWGVDYATWPDCDPIEYDFIEALEAADCSIIFSAGNEGPDDETTGMPASIAKDTLNIFSVGALDAEDVDYTIADFSSRGPTICATGSSLEIKPEVSAPGVNVRSASGTDTYKLLSGTSMAGPHVAGAVLLLREAFPNITSQILKNALYQTATDLGDLGEDNVYGRGLINLKAAYDFLSQDYTPTPPITNQFDIAIDSIVGPSDYTCSLSNHYDIVIENKGEASLSDFIFRVVLNNDTIFEDNLNISLNSNAFYTIPFDIDLVDTNNTLVFQIEKQAVAEFNIYNNFRAYSITRLFTNSIPYYEDFEQMDSTFYNSNYVMLNSDLSRSWDIVPTSGIDNSERSLKMRFAYYTPRLGQIDELLSGGFDIPVTGNTYMFFKHAYTQYFSNNRDSLFILAGESCYGINSDTIFKNGGEGLRTRGIVMGNFVPSNSDDWADNAINLTDYAGQTIFFRFVAKNDGSNNLYIDNLRIENGIDLSVNAMDKERLKVYPNPTTGEFNIRISKLKYTEVYTLGGLLIRNTTKRNIDLSNQPKGIYFVKVVTENGVYTKKLVLE